MSQIKITANSAEEAVKVIKDRFGDRAQVLKVQKVEQGGFKGLLSKPRLEIIVAVPTKPEAVPLEASKPAVVGAQVGKTEVKSTPEAKAKAMTAREGESASTPIGKLYAKKDTGAASDDYFGGLGDSVAHERSDSDVSAKPESTAARLGSAANPVRNGTLEAVKRGISMMESVGFDSSLIERMRAEIDFKTVGALPTVDLYSRICDWLRNNFPDMSDEQRGVRRAFIGTCGSGKTSALCKALSSDVFVNNLQPTVLKVDTDVPNSSDGLEAFCEIMGSALVRSTDELEEVDPDQPLYIDMPGLNVVDPEKVDACGALLDELDVDERILVVNAAYDSDLIAAAFEAGRRVGARYAVFTHLDEAIRVGKLWKFALNSNIRPLFVSHGSNPAGDYSYNVYSFLLERSFPNGRELMSSKSKKTTASRREQPSEGVVA